MAIDYILLRPRRKDNIRQEFLVVLRKEIRVTQHQKLGLYDPKHGKIEEWCHKEDFDWIKADRLPLRLLLDQNTKQATLIRCSLFLHSLKIRWRQTIE